MKARGLTLVNSYKTEMHLAMIITGWLYASRTEFFAYYFIQKYLERNSIKKIFTNEAPNLYCRFLIEAYKWRGKVRSN